MKNQFLGFDLGAQTYEVDDNFQLQGQINLVVGFSFPPNNASSHRHHEGSAMDSQRILKRYLNGKSSISSKVTKPVTDPKINSVDSSKTLAGYP